MEINKQKQISGDNSQSIQGTYVSIENYNYGITEERCHEIFQEEQKLANECTKESQNIINDRLNCLEQAVMSLLGSNEDYFRHFSDPSFQRVLRKSQQAAACTERENDYDMLAELLLCHIQKGSDRKKRTGIDRAIEIIDMLDDDALCALTVAYAILTYIPTNEMCTEGLAELNDLYSKLMYMELPTGTNWLDHLDLLGAMRVSPITKIKKFKDYYQGFLNGYACTGIKKESENYKKACKIIEEAGLPANLLCPNECLEGFVRLPVSNKKLINELTVTTKDSTRLINPNEIDALNKVFGLYSKNSTELNTTREKFITLWDNFESLKKIHLWWDDINWYFSITEVGEILAYTNAKRCDPSLPSLDI